MSGSQARVQEALDTLVAYRIERGAQFAVYRDGRLLVDAWAGTANFFTQEPVDGEVLFPVFSVTKGISATVIHRLVERGLVGYDTPIAEVWPEFGENGKQDITLRHALEHTAGLPALPPGLLFSQMIDWESACQALAKSAAKYPPGSQFAYHAKTYGWLVGEVARRVDGRFFTDLVQDEVARPLGLDSLHVGLPEQSGRRVAFLEEKHLGPLAPLREYEIGNMPAAKVLMPHQMNNPAMQAACLPSTNGMMNARAIAKHYASLLPSGADGVCLLPPDRLALATNWKTRNDPEGQAATWGLGYQKIEASVGNRTIQGFGHGGYGGSMGVAIPEYNLAIGFTRNLLGESGWPTLLAALFDEEWEFSPETGTVLASSS